MKKKKKKKKELFVYHASALPRNSNINFLRNERQRIQVFNTDDIAETRTRLGKYLTHQQLS